MKKKNLHTKNTRKSLTFQYNFKIIKASKKDYQNGQCTFYKDNGSEKFPHNMKIP